MKIARRAHADDAALKDIDDALIRQILASRGIKSAQDAGCDLAGLAHYRTLPDIEKAASAVADAVSGGVKILVFGDYDVDGMTGAALGVRALRALGCAADQVSCRVPSRYEGGYGLSPDEVAAAAAQGVGLILTVDNGISCHEAAEKAAGIGIKLVITDHHECGAQLPKALAVVDPKRPDSAFPSRALCGAGVLFYVLSAVRACLDERGFYHSRPRPVMADFLGLVALGTVGDVVPFDPNNRRLVAGGLSRLRQGRAGAGIRALCARTRCSLDTLDPHAISFELCPRLNAAGRIRIEGNPALELLLTDDPAKAEELSQRLDLCNRRRGDFEKVFLKEALEDAQSQGGGSGGALTLYRPGWLCGITGLIAGKVKDSCGVPCFVFSRQNGALRGSARSVLGVPLGEILKRMGQEHPGLLLAGGGHAMAAGATIAEESLEEFRAAFAKYAAAFRQGPEESVLETDGELPPDHFSLQFARALEDLGPWGEGFPEPLFDGNFEISEVRPIQNRHLRFALTGSDGRRVQAIRFRAQVREKALTPGVRVRAVYALEVNRYQGTERLQMRLEAIEPL